MKLHTSTGRQLTFTGFCFCCVVRFGADELRHRPSRTESKDTRRHLLILLFGYDPIPTQASHFNDEGRRQDCEDRVQGKPVFPVFPVQGHLNT
jgi:hypothetical protein